MLDTAFDILARLDDAIGRNWFKHAQAAGAADDLLRVVTADGMFTTKIDGWIHAANATTRSIRRFVESDVPPQLDLQEFTSWSGGNAALRYGRWQTDFHWKIDTRLWQYVLYLKFMRDAYRDAIDECDELAGDQRTALQRVVTEFFDQAELALVYRWEVIERSRGFATHPDATAGAATHGYTYEVLRPLPKLAFADLPLDFSPETNGRAGGEQRRDVPSFPRLDGHMKPGLQEIARDWLDRARELGVADRWLCVSLGERMVPTRFNGWESGIEIVLPFLLAYARGGRVSASETGVPSPPALGAFDLRDAAVRFGLCQAEFQRRLRGGRDELLALVEALRRALGPHAGTGAAGEPLRRVERAKVDDFFQCVSDTASRSFSAALELEESVLPELSGRPLHPRFAPYDPMEPLPWESSSPDLYLRRMERLGYVI